MAICKTVMLIDDDEIFTLVAENTINMYGFAEQVIAFNTATDALSFLQDSANNSSLYPDVIFLDINMPVMDGWGFLETYKQFPQELKSQAQLYMLSSSLDETDVLRSQQYEEVRDFIRKPLSKINLEALKFRIECGKE